MDGYESVRSAHIQVPYKLAQDLKRLGYDVLIATNPLSKGTPIPNDISHIPIKFIPDPRKRKDGYVMHTGFSNKIDIFEFLKQLLLSRNLLGKIKIQQYILLMDRWVLVYLPLLQVLLLDLVKLFGPHHFHLACQVSYFCLCYDRSMS